MHRSAVFVIMLPFFCACVFGAVQEEGISSSALEKDFRVFLEAYCHKIESRDPEYLKVVHPDLPTDTHTFFFDITSDMMSYAKQEGLEPKIECKEFGVCKVTWPQPGGGWAAQRFIRHRKQWRWLE